MTSFDDLGLAPPAAARRGGRFEDLGLAPPTQPAQPAENDAGSLWDGLKNFASGVAGGASGEGVPAGRASEFSGGRAGFGGRMVGAGARSIAEGLWEGIKAPGEYLRGEKTIGPGTSRDALGTAMLMAGQGGRRPIVTEAEPSAAALSLRDRAGSGPNPFEPSGGGRVEPLAPVPPPQPLPPVINTGPQPPILGGQAFPEQRPGIPARPGGGTAPAPPLPPVIPTGPQPPRLTGQALPEARPGLPAPPAGRTAPPQAVGEVRQQPPNLPISGQAIGPTSAGVPRPPGGSAAPLLSDAVPTSPLADAIAQNDGSAIDRTLTRTYRRAVQPRPLDGQRGYAGLTEQDRRITTAVDDILANRATLRVSDRAGEKIPLPANPNMLQFAEALDQTKRAVFQLYDRQAQVAGGAGVRVDLAPVIAKARALAGDVVATDLSPAARSEASRLASILEARGSYSPLQAQDMIEAINDMSKAFWRGGGSFKDATPLSVINQVGRVLREEMDKAISTQGGPSYQALRLRYQSLRTVEQEVATAVLKRANKPGGGLPYQFADLMTADQFIHGIVDPANFLTHAGGAAATMTGKRLVQYLRDPNRAIGRMFARRAYHADKPPYALGRTDVPGSPYSPGAGLTQGYNAGVIDDQRGPYGGRVLNRSTVNP